LKALPHEFAAMHPVEVLPILSSRAHELADLVEACRRKPAFATPALNSNAIGLYFIRPHGLVGAFMAENPQFHRRSEASEKVRVKNEEAFICTAKVVRVGVEDRRRRAACHTAAVNLGPTCGNKRPPSLSDVNLWLQIAVERLRRAGSG
jgi:hypothetical protein